MLRQVYRYYLLPLEEVVPRERDREPRVARLLEIMEAKVWRRCFVWGMGRWGGSGGPGWNRYLRSWRPRCVWGGGGGRGGDNGEVQGARVARLLVYGGGGAEPSPCTRGTLFVTGITDRDCSDTHHRIASSPVCRSWSAMLCRGRGAMRCQGRSVVVICRGKNAMAALSCPRSPLSAGHCGLHRWHYGPPLPPSPLLYQPPPPPLQCLPLPPLLQYLLPLPLLLRCCPDPPPLQYRPSLWQ